MTPNRTTPTVPSTPAPSTRTDVGRDAHDQAMASWRRQLDDAKSKIDALRTRAGSAGENVRTDFTNTVHDLDDQADQVQSRLNQYKDTGSTNWDSFRSDIDSMIARLNQQIREASDKFSDTNPDGLKKFRGHDERKRERAAAGVMDRKLL